MRRLIGSNQGRAVELKNPGVHRPVELVICYVDGYRELSIYDVRFMLTAGEGARPPARARVQFFSIVQLMRSTKSTE